MVPALNALRIFTREQEGSSQLVTPNGLAPLVRLAGLDSQFVEMREFFGGENIDDGQVNGKREGEGEREREREREITYNSSE